MGELLENREGVSQIFAQASIPTVDGKLPVTASQLYQLPLAEWDRAIGAGGPPTNLNEFESHLRNRLRLDSAIIENNLPQRAELFANGHWDEMQRVQKLDLEGVADRARPPAAQLEEFQQLYTNVFRHIEENNLNGPQAREYAQEQFQQVREQIGEKIDSVMEQYRRPASHEPSPDVTPEGTNRGPAVSPSFA